MDANYPYPRIDWDRRRGLRLEAMGKDAYRNAVRAWGVSFGQDDPVVPSYYSELSDYDRLVLESAFWDTRSEDPQRRQAALDTLQDAMMSDAEFSEAYAQEATQAVLDGVSSFDMVLDFMGYKKTATFAYDEGVSCVTSQASSRVGTAEWTYDEGAGAYTYSVTVKTHMNLDSTEVGQGLWTDVDETGRRRHNFAYTFCPPVICKNGVAVAAGSCAFGQQTVFFGPERPEYHMTAREFWEDYFDPVPLQDLGDCVFEGSVSHVTGSSYSLGMERVGGSVECGLLDLPGDGSDYSYDAGGTQGEDRLTGTRDGGGEDGEGGHEFDRDGTCELIKRLKNPDPAENPWAPYIPNRTGPIPVPGGGGGGPVPPGGGGPIPPDGSGPIPPGGEVPIPPGGGGPLPDYGGGTDPGGFDPGDYPLEGPEGGPFGGDPYEPFPNPWDEEPIPGWEPPDDWAPPDGWVPPDGYIPPTDPGWEVPLGWEPEPFEPPPDGGVIDPWAPTCVTFDTPPPGFFDPTQPGGIGARYQNGQAMCVTDETNQEICGEIISTKVNSNGSVEICIQPVVPGGGITPEKVCYTGFIQDNISQVLQQMGFGGEIIFDSEPECVYFWDQPVCFDPGTPYATILNYFLNMCGWCYFPQFDGNVIVGYCGPKDVHWYFHEDESDAFGAPVTGGTRLPLVGFDLEYDNREAYAFVEVYCDDYRNADGTWDRGYSIPYPVPTPAGSAVDSGQIYFHEVPRGTSYADASALAATLAQKLAWRNTPLIAFKVPINHQLDYRDQIHVQRPSLTFDQAYMVTRLRKEWNREEGYFSQGLARYLGA